MQKKLKNVTESDVMLSDIGVNISPGEVVILDGWNREKFIVSSDCLQAIKDSKLQCGLTNTPDDIYYTDPKQSEIFFLIDLDDKVYYIDQYNEITNFISSITTDTVTGIKSTKLILSILTMMKDLYNDSTNPLYDSDYSPLIGSNCRIDTLENYSNKVFYKTSYEESSTTSLNYRNKLNLIFTPLVAGNYKIDYGMSLYCSRSNTPIKTLFKLTDSLSNETDYKELSQGISHTSNSKIWQDRSGFFILNNLTNQQYNIDLNYCSGSSGKTVYIKDAVIMIKLLPDSSGE